MCFIRHRDEVVDQTVLPSAWEQTASIQDKIAEFNASPEMFYKPVVTTLRCLNCGRVRVVRR